MKVVFWCLVACGAVWVWMGLRRRSEADAALAHPFNQGRSPLPGLCVDCWRDAWHPIHDEALWRQRDIFRRHGLP